MALNNSLRLFGNLVRDPEVKEFTYKDKDGNDKTSFVANATIAINDANGKADFIPLRVFGEARAKKFAEFCHQGDSITVEGSIDSNPTVKDGNHYDNVFCSVDSYRNHDYAKYLNNEASKDEEVAGPDMV